MLTEMNRKTRLRRGDRIKWDKKSQRLSVRRSGNRLFWGNTPDDKDDKSSSAIDYTQVLSMVQMLANAVLLKPEIVRNEPTVLIFDLS